MDKCEAGCKAFTGGEIYHHKDCVFYPNSMSKMFDDAKATIKEYGGLLDRTLRAEATIKAMCRVVDRMVNDGVQKDDGVRLRKILLKAIIGNGEAQTSPSNNLIAK